MEQPRTRPPQARPRRTAPLPPQAQGGQDGAAPSGESATVYRAARGGPPTPGRRPLRFPNPRLTGRGSGLFCIAAMLVFGFLDRLLFAGSPAVYGVLFLLVSGLTAVWVRGADLVTAPVVVPIAFAVGIVPISEGTGGFGPQVMGLATTLAMNAIWLYGGTLITGVLVTVRKVRLMARRAAVRRAGGRKPSGGKASPSSSQAPGPRRRTA
ncbi:DUF6542 domain-containing protein [Streptomyces sp. NPDC102360]|uniref:DUF6542 domain-containing protein n=1 Tax=Streptomyces sp. NPDC102360 TaxID=3366160 RepID=UPI0037FBB8BB